MHDQKHIKAISDHREDKGYDPGHDKRHYKTEEGYFELLIKKHVSPLSGYLPLVALKQSCFKGRRLVTEDRHCRVHLHKS